MQTSRKQKFHALIPLFLIIFIDSMNYGLIIPVLLRILQTSTAAGHLSESSSNILFGLGIAISPLAYLIAAPIVGRASDQWGRKKTMLVCLVGACIGYILPIIGVIAGSLTFILIGRALAGGATCSQPIAWAAVTDISEGKEKAFLLSLVAFAMTLAMVAGPLLGGYLSDSHLVSWFNNTTPFITATLLSVVNLILMLIFLPETHPQKKASAKLTLKKMTAAFTAILTHSSLRPLLLIFFIYEFSWSLYFQDISLYLSKAHHYDIDQISLFITYSGAWMSLGLTLIYRIMIHYLSLPRILGFCLTVATLGLIGCSMTSSAVLQWLYIIPVSIAVGMAYPTTLALMSNQTSADEQGWVMGVAATLLALSWMLSALITGVLTNIALALPLQTAFLAMLCATLIFFWGNKVTDVKSLTG